MIQQKEQFIPSNDKILCQIMSCRLQQRNASMVANPLFNISNRKL